MGDRAGQRDISIMDVLTDRGKQYGNSFPLAGKVIQVVLNYGGANADLFRATPYAAYWVIMMVKMIRFVFDPKNPDHLRDVMAFARLILEDQNFIVKEASDVNGAH